MNLSSFYIHERIFDALPASRYGNQFHRADRCLCASLTYGDTLNDKIERRIHNIDASRDELAMVDRIAADVRMVPGLTVFVLGFTASPARRLKAAKAEYLFPLVAVNAWNERHPAALVAIADRTLRLREHHVSCQYLRPDRDGAARKQFSDL